MRQSLFDKIKEIFSNIIKSRLLVLTIVMLILSFILIQRMFQLQIINGQEYLDNYTLKIEKNRELASTRGNIYDRNGRLLAYNELAYAITLEDNGTYESREEKNKALNQELYRLIKVLDKNKDQIKNDFYISYSQKDGYQFTVSGSTLKRFLADIYDHKTTEELGYNKDLGYDESQAQPEQIIEYLASEDVYDISSKYSEYDKYRILVLRYAIAQNSYQKFILTVLATGVCDKTVAWVSENADDLQGMEVSEETIRKYNDSEYFAHIIGYTGKISVEEYEELSKKDDSYALTDIIGKSGIEQVMDETLQGKKGYEKISVDNVGRVVETLERKEPQAGNDVYLSLDADLTKAVYDLLEQEIAGIIYSNIINAKEFHQTTASSDNIQIPIDDVYFAFINNNVIDTDHFKAEDASSTEKQVYSAYTSKEASVLSQLKRLFSGADNTAFGDLGEEEQDYITAVINRLKSEEILDPDSIDASDEQYIAWKEGDSSLNAYLNHAITEGWVDISKFSVGEKYSDSEEIFDSLISFILEDLKEDRDFQKLIYKYMIRENRIGGTQLCLILYEQGILPEDDQMAALAGGSISAFNFVREKIHNMEITPDMLALDPCSGSCVITNVNTGEILALVSYPGYDNNRLANSVDSDYYASLSSNLSLPLYNYATQQRTAPGSTFKMVSATAGLTEGVITTGTVILDKGQFERFENGPKCWIFPSSHGAINVAGAIRDSCNYFFYEVGYQLSMAGESYSESKGLKAIEKYAKQYGLGDVTGIETPESEPQIANEYPVTAAIGQSNHNFTTAGLARYVTAVANSGTVYDETLLKKVCDSDGHTIEEFAPTVKNKVDLPGSTWDAIHSGMRMVVQGLAPFADMTVEVAGKTGTAQQVTNRPNHALFVGYAPYGNPEISIATRIAYGYTSGNAADVSAKILKYYFKSATEEELLSGHAESVDASSNSVTD